jgi:hypothetical protein
MYLRAPSEQALEWRDQTIKVRTAARRGKSPQEIADLQQLPIAAVERILAPIKHVRISDPVQLLRGHADVPGTASADVHVYWLGFLMATGRILGQGTSLTLVVTLGELSREYVGTFMADLTTDYVRCEYCYSNIEGWQAYLRDPSLCKALFPWGVPSDLHGDDSALLDDLSAELAIPFIRGYVDGDRSVIHASNNGSTGRFAVRGAPAVLARINSMVQRYWGVGGGTVTSRRDGAELRFSDAKSCRIIHNQLNTYGSRLHA